MTTKIHNFRPLTPEEARERLSEQGLTAREFCRRHQLSPTIVSELLTGKSNRRALRGQTYRAAVLLGLKLPSTAHAKDNINTLNMPTQSTSE